MAVTLAACSSKFTSQGSTPLAEAGSPTDPGVGLPSRGCGLGTSCSPGADLAAPASADGFQIATPPGAYTVQPHQETFLNYCAIVPYTAEFDVGTVQSWMTAGSSHDLIVYRSSSPPDGGTGAGCTLGADIFTYMASVAGQIVELKMPPGVGVPLLPGTQIILSMHFANLGDSPIQPQVKVNFVRAVSYQHEAAALPSFNVMINVPAATAVGPGAQTVKGTCHAPAGSQFFAIGTHTNSLATAADVSLVSGGAATNVVHTTDWEHPDVGLWPAPPFLTLKDGDSLAYSCTYSNEGDASVTVGEDQQGNEVCMMVGYYFPAGSASCN